MYRSSLAQPLCLCGLLLVVVVAVAQRKVCGLRVDPESPCAGSPATFQVTRQGACQGSLDFGDNTQPADFTDLPFQVQHTYASSGTYDAASVHLEPTPTAIQTGKRIRLSSLAADQGPCLFAELSFENSIYFSRSIRIFKNVS